MYSASSSHAEQPCTDPGSNRDVAEGGDVASGAPSVFSERGDGDVVIKGDRQPKSVLNDARD